MFFLVNLHSFCCCCFYCSCHRFDYCDSVGNSHYLCVVQEYLWITKFTLFEFQFYCKSVKPLSFYTRSIHYFDLPNKMRSTIKKNIKLWSFFTLIVVLTRLCFEYFGISVILFFKKSICLIRFSRVSSISGLIILTALESTHGQYDLNQTSKCGRYITKSDTKWNYLLFIESFSHFFESF